MHCWNPLSREGLSPGYLRHSAAPRSFPRLQEQSSHQSIFGLCPWIIYDLFFTSDDHRSKLSISCSLASSEGSPSPPFQITPFAIKSGCLRSSEQGFPRPLVPFASQRPDLRLGMAAGRVGGGACVCEDVGSREMEPGWPAAYSPPCRPRGKAHRPRCAQNKGSLLREHTPATTTCCGSTSWASLGRAWLCGCSFYPLRKNLSDVNIQPNPENKDRSIPCSENTFIRPSKSSWEAAHERSGARLFQLSLSQRWLQEAAGPGWELPWALAAPGTLC